MLCMTTKSIDNLDWFEEVFFEPENNVFCSNHSLIVKRLTAVHDNQSQGSSVLLLRNMLRIGNPCFSENHSIFVKRLSVVHYSQGLSWSALIWKGLLRLWSKRFLQTPFSDCETSQCCPWQPKPSIIGTDLTGPASNLKPMVSVATILLWWNVSMLSMTAETYLVHPCLFLSRHQSVLRYKFLS